MNQEEEEIDDDEESALKVTFFVKIPMTNFPPVCWLVVNTIIYKIGV